MDKQQVLIIEDDREICQLLADFLQAHGYAVHCQYDGRDLLKRLETLQPAVVLLDLMLPYQSGDSLLAEIRRVSTVLVLIISAKETTQNKIDLLRLGADDYITKPFDLEEVLTRIESNLRRVHLQSAQRTLLQFEDLVLDMDNHTAYLKQVPLSLTAKEFAILALLMAHPNKIFSKTNLFQSVWHAEYTCEDNTLNVHISNLRNKLKAICPEQAYIDTVWGIGYRLHKVED
ncbi:MAG: response regulator transcription factor [Peptococcaceae bacterium]|nr:response regulator transcription factor [Peptococcaceae bacterium]